jgi:RNase H-like protein
MTRRYLAFDIETAKDVPGDDFNWRPHRPLGISCAATLASDENQPRLWYSKTKDGTPDKRMGRSDVQELLQHLSKTTANGYSVLTWNGLGFDFDILAEESAAAASCKACALAHVDMMFHVFCSLGYPVSLDKAAQGMRLPGKPPGMSGVKAPKLWAEGRFKEVLEYVGQDVRTAMQLAQSCEQRKKLEWITRKGTKSSMPLPKGWLNVKEALKLPEPDTSWMSAPLPRSDFITWLGPIE